jgi:hypothetical protein
MGSVQEAFDVDVAKGGCFDAFGPGDGQVGQNASGEGAELEEGRRERARRDATWRRGRRGVAVAFGDGWP